MSRVCVRLSAIEGDLLIFLRCLFGGGRFSIARGTKNTRTARFDTLREHASMQDHKLASPPRIWVRCARIALAVVMWQ